MADYIAYYAFELQEPVDNQHGGYGELQFSTERPLQHEDDWQEVARQCFIAGDGKYKQVSVLRIGELEESTETETPEDVIIGEIIE